MKLKLPLTNYITSPLFLSCVMWVIPILNVFTYQKIQGPPIQNKICAYETINTSGIEGIVWTDINGNGIRETPEIGLPGFTVQLYDNNGNNITLTTTDINGFYQFNALPPGEYRVHFQSVGPYFITQQNVEGGPDQDTDAENDSDADQATGESFEIHLEENEILQHVDAGYFKTGQIQGEIWEDDNTDGIKQNGESKREGISVSLKHEDGRPVYDVNGHLVQPIPSLGNGTYRFSDLIPSSYKVVWSLEHTCQFTLANYSGKNADHNDIGNDSDAVNGTSHLILLTSNRNVNGIDAGIKNLSNISGETFYDQNKNGIRDENDLFGPTLRVELWEISGINPCPEGSKSFLGYIPTNSFHSYFLNNIKPGKYFIRLDSLHFEPFEILDGYKASTPTEFCVDVDCNLPRFNFELGFYRPCDTLDSWDQWQNCEIASQNLPVCDLRVLEGGCKSMFAENSPEPNPKPLCPGGGAAHNTSWIPFIAGFGSYEISINPINCSSGGGGQIGIQAGIYTDCSFTDAVYCQPECSDENITIPSWSLVPGQKYYLFIDGCAESICDYEFEINGQYSPFHFPDSNSLVLQTIQDTFCPNETITFLLQGLDLASEYKCSVKNENGTIPDLIFPMGWPTTNKNTLALSFPKPGTYSVCMDQVTNTCDFRGSYCKSVVIQNKNSYNFITRDTLVNSGDTISTLVALPNDTSSTIYVLPLNNEFVMNMKSDTLHKGMGIVIQQLYNTSQISQIAKYLLYKDSTNLADCTSPDTLSIKVLPMNSIYEFDVRLCHDSCTTISAILPDSISPWIQYFWNTGDTTANIDVCPTKDTFFHVFVRDTLDVYYKIRFHVIPEDIFLDFNVQTQPACKDSIILINFQALLHNFPGEDFLYVIFDCAHDLPVHIYSGDTSGIVSIPLLFEPDTLCYRLDVYSSNCQYSTYLTISNPKNIIGKPCDDNNDLTNNDVYDDDCECLGQWIDNVSEISIRDNVKIYPNPTTGMVNITGKSNLRSLQIYNSVGVHLNSKIMSIDSGIQVDFTTYPSGIYMLVLLIENLPYTFKMVKF